MFCYIHIPFCESKCKYCRFASVGGINKILVEKYFVHLIDDIKNFIIPTPVSQKTGVPLKSIYFGGGTPSILNTYQFNEFLQTLQNKFGFENNIEITLETTPKNLTKENIHSWERLGINRISIGVQSLNNTTLREIRRDEKDIILNGLNNLRNTQIKNISVDFIIGLPYVQAGETLHDIKYILETYHFIQHISVYMLEDYYGEKEDNSHFEKILYPNTWKNLGIKEEDYLKEYGEIKHYLETRGFFRYELSNFAKNGYECKHNMSYWDHSDNIGFGLGSHSFIGGKRYAYKDDFLGYHKGEFAYEEFLSEDDIFLEKVMFGLRTGGIGKNIYKNLNWKKTEELIQSGLLEIKNEHLMITDNGISLIDRIILEII